MKKLCLILFILLALGPVGLCSLRAEMPSYSISRPRQTSSSQEPLSVVEVEVGPNVRVSDKPEPYVEPYIAAHPTDPNRLIMSASRSVRDKGIIAEAWFSADGGKTWSVSALPRMQEVLSSGRLEFALDNWVAYAPAGVAFYSTLVSLRETPDSPINIWIYRSNDNGVTWRDPVVIPGKALDRPVLIAAGNERDTLIYVASMVDGQDSLVVRQRVTTSTGIVVFKSNDGGLSFKTGVFVAHDNLGHNASNPLVLADGSLLVPYIDFPIKRSQRMNSSRAYVIRSQDEGQSFGLPQFVAERDRTQSPFAYFPQFAVDLSNRKFRGRVYAVWNGKNQNRVDTYITHSTDNGQTWSAGKFLRDPSAGNAVFAAAAVSTKGDVGVFWIQDEKDESKPHRYRAYFAASLNGGETFTPAYVVSTDVSQADGARNQEKRCPTCASIFKRWPRGGDYIGITASADGSFHPVWIDSREGIFQVYTTRIQLKDRAS
jgi:hypothetical protein